MELVTALKDLGFSFWQLLVVFLVLYFRTEIRQLFERMKSFKVLGNEFSLVEKEINHIRELKMLEGETKKEGVTIQDIHDELSSVLKRRCIGALLNIRSMTLVLWPHLKNIQINQTAIVVDIRLSTYNEIETDLRLLLPFHSNIR